jgi:hypothetical protein
MKTTIMTILLLASLLGTGCTEKRGGVEKAKQDTAAKAHARAAKKEMETLPKVFETPDYYKKNEASKTTPPSPQKTETIKK